LIRNTTRSRSKYCNRWVNEEYWDQLRRNIKVRRCAYRQEPDTKEYIEMPKGTKVEKIYEAIVRSGKSKASAAKIAQSKTGKSLATGKKPKGKKK